MINFSLFVKIFFHFQGKNEAGASQINSTFACTPSTASAGRFIRQCHGLELTYTASDGAWNPSQSLCDDRDEISLHEECARM